MKKIWRRTAWLILLIMIFSIFPSNLVIASENKDVITEELTEEEINRLLENLLLEASDEADIVVEELNLMEKDPIKENEDTGELAETEELNEYEDTGELAETEELSEYEEPTEENSIEEIPIEDETHFNALDLDEEEYRQWKLNIIESSNFNRSFSLFRVENNIISNEYIGVKIHENGLINMGTTGGNPDSETDNNKDLLYHYPNSTTSFTTIKVDGENHNFFSDGPPTFNEDGTQAEAIMTIGDITIKQIISFMYNPNTGREDIAEIKYETINNGETAHSVGTRIMLDTMLGNNDGAPFKVPGIGDVTKEIEIVGNRIPQYWQAFDDLDNPSIIASGAFYKNFNERPDKVQFVAWPGIYHTDWSYEIDPETLVTMDSAVGIYFNPREVRPQETVAVATYYGIGDFLSSDADDDLSLRVTAPQELQVNTQTGNYYSNPFTITAYIKNNSLATAENVKLILNLPVGGELTLSNPTTNIINVGDLAPGREKTVSFSVLANSQTSDKTVNYSMELKADNIDGKLLNFTLHLPKASISQGGSITLNKTGLTLQKGETFRLQAALNNISGNVTWFSDNSTVATVSSTGLVTARSAGTANIKASVGGMAAICSVKVTGETVRLTGVSFSPSTVNLAINKSLNLNLVFTPSNAPNKRIKSWTSSDPSIVSVTASGRVTGLKKGTAIIKAVTEEGNITATCTVNVIELEPVLETGNGINFQDNANGPTINFAGKSFPLFKAKVGTEIKFADRVKLVYDPSEDKYVAYVGDLTDVPGTNDTNPDGTLTEEAKQLRKDTYQALKRMMNMVGKKTNREFYNSYRRLIRKASPFSVEGKKSVFGYVEFVKTANGYRLARGEICVLFEGSVNCTYNFPPAPVVYVKFSVGGSVQTGLELRLAEAGNLKGGLNVAGKAELAFTPSVGIGGDIGIANVEGGLEGELKSVMRFNPRFSLEEMTIEGKLYLKYQAFLFINNKHWIKLGKHQFYPRGNSRLAGLSAMEINSDDLVPIHRDYMQRPSQFTANRSGISAFSMNNSNIINNTLKTNVYPYGKPQLVLLPEGKMFLAWIDDNRSRQYEANYTALYYSVYDGTAWSLPEQIDNDGTADFSPCVITVGDAVYIAWQNAEKEFEETVTLEEVAKNMGIKAAKWKDNEIKTYEITIPDEIINNPPVIIGDDTNVAIVWTKNTANDIFGIEGETAVLRSILSGEAFTKPTEILESDGMINGLTSSFDNGKIIIVYSQDMDGDIETFEDRELMMIIEDEYPINITNNEVADINPKLVRNGNSTELYWYSEDGISCMPNINSREIFKIEGEKPIGSNFNVIKNDQERAIIWENSKGFKSDLFCIFYDSEKRQWGDAVQITDLDTRIRDTSAILTEDGNMYMSYISAPVVENLEEDKSPFKDADLMVTKLSPGYDLMLDEGVVYDWRLVYGGSELTLGCYVENQGQKTINGLTATVYNGDELAAQSDIDIVLGSGKGEFIDIPYHLPSEIAAHDISIIVLPKNGTDYDLSNNAATANIGEAEISVNKPIVTGMGSNRTITAEIKNLGYAGSGEIIVELAAKEDDNEKIIDTAAISSIPGQGSRIVEFNMPITRNTFTSSEQDSILVYVNAMNGKRERLDSNFTQIENVYELDAITLSSVAMAGNTIILDIDNNLPETVKGLLCVESIDEYSEKIIYAQEIDMEPLYGESMQLDLSGIEMNYNLLKVYVLGEDDRIISNVADINEHNILKVLKPTATPIPGVYNKSQRITLTTSTEGANIYYTIDGSEPTTNSILYTQPILVDKTMTIKAKAVKQGMIDSEVQVLQYVIQIDSPPTPPVDPPTHYPKTSKERTDRTDNKVNEKTFLERYKELSDEQKSKILNSIPYTINAGYFNMEQLKNITNNYFTDKQLQDLVGNPEILIKLLKDNNIDYQIMNLTLSQKLSFKDMTEDHWAMPYINRALELGYVKGFEDGTFRPNNPLMVEDTFAFLDRVLVAHNVLNNKLPRNIVESYITNKEHWSYYSTASISSRLSEPTLKKVLELKDGLMTRELLAQIVYEITEGKLPQIEELKTFNDISQSKYKEALDYCIKIGLLNGTSNTTMEPKKFVTRSEMMAIISRLDDMFR